MRTYQIAAASAAMCTSLLLVSYLKAAEVEPGVQTAQMNRSSYGDIAVREAAPVVVPPRHPQDRRQSVAAVAQMNRALYARPEYERPEPAAAFPRRPVSKPAPLSAAFAQMNRGLYDR